MRRPLLLMGLAPVLVEQVFDSIVDINKQGVTCILVEQNAVRALQLADRAVILDTGEVVFDGTAKPVQKLQEEWMPLIEEIEAVNR